MKQLWAKWHGLDENERALKVVQPFLVGLVDGSLSSLAPIFTLAVAVGSHAALLAGLAASLGAAISMAVAEGISDDGALTGRGTALSRGIVVGFGTLVGGLMHTLPFLINDKHVALAVAVPFVIIELLVISWIRKRYQNVSFLKSFLQVTVAGIAIIACGVIIGDVA